HKRGRTADHDRCQNAGDEQRSRSHESCPFRRDFTPLGVHRLTELDETQALRRQVWPFGHPSLLAFAGFPSYVFGADGYSSGCAAFGLPGPPVQDRPLEEVCDRTAKRAETLVKDNLDQRAAFLAVRHLTVSDEKPRRRFCWRGRSATGRIFMLQVKQRQIW